MNAKISVFAICAQAIIYLLLSKLHECTLNIFDEIEFIEFRFTRILFGLASSPFLLLETRIKYISQFIKEEPIFVETRLNSPHVDDLIAGESSVETSYKFFLKSKTKIYRWWF